MELFDLYKQSHTNEVVLRDIANNMINHSYMIVSFDTLLIKAYAKYVASAFLCTGENKPCDECSVCKRIQHGNFSDVIEYPKDNKCIMTEDINNIVMDEVVLPYEADKKIYILYNFDNATVQAQNKLLKTLEEPNKSTIFILTVNNMDNVLPTIRSRSKIIVEHALDDDVIQEYLEQDGVDKMSAKLVASKSFGNLSYALNHAKSVSGREIITLARDILNNMKDSSMVLEYASKVQKYKDNLQDLASIMLSHVADMSRLIALGEQSDVYNLGMYNLRSLGMIAKLCEQTIKKDNANCNPNAIIDGLLFGILEVRYLCSNA